MVCLIPPVFRDIADIVAVGGSVRDYLLGKQSCDIDLASSFSPEMITHWARQRGFRTIATGAEHGTITVLVNEIPFEHTTFRSDVSCDGRNATVAFSDNVETDLSRRDFTINAIAQNVFGELIDPFNGQQDLADKVIRTVGDPRERFAEDYLRIIRAARFAARFGFTIQENTFAAAKELSPHILEHVSVERIFQEFNKAFSYPQPSTFLQILWDFGLIQRLFPEYKAAHNLKQNPEWHPEGSIWNHLLETVDRAEPEVRWHAFLHDVGKPATAAPVENTDHFCFYGHAKVGADLVPEIAQRLKWPNSLAESVEQVTLLHMIPTDYAKAYGTRFPDRIVRKLKHRAGKHYEELKGLVRADFGDDWENIEDLFRPIEDPVSPVLTGKLLIEAGVNPGPEMGRLLALALHIQIDEGIFDPQELLRRVLDGRTDKPEG